MSEENRSGAAPSAHEKLCDIIIMLRRRATEMEKSLGDQHSFVEEWRHLADRIQMALQWERACTAGSINAMKVKMRHALTQVELFLSRVERHGHPTLNPGDRCDACEGVEELRTLVCAALAEEQTNDSELVKLFTESDAVLKPCPFCGAQARLVHFGMEYIVECTFCDASTVSGGTRERSINVWNTRTYPMDLPKFHEALLKIAHYCDKKENMDDCGCGDGWILSDIAKVALIRPATVQEVKDGKAKWCSVCDANCPNKGKDLRRMCERFEDARATVVAKGAK